MFDQFDDDSNGFIEKSEMSILIKKTFPLSKEQLELNAIMKKAKANKENSKPMAKLFGDYVINLAGDADAIYD